MRKEGETRIKMKETGIYKQTKGDSVEQDGEGKKMDKGRVIKK